MSTEQPGYPIVIREFFYREAARDYHVPAHIQHCPQWYCVIHGCVEHRIDGQSYLLRAHESVFIPAKAVREPRARSDSVGYIVCTFDNLRLNLQAIERRLLLCPPLLRGDVHALVAELRAGPSPERQDLLRSLLTRIFIGLRRDARVKPPASDSTSASPLNLNSNQALVEKLDNYMRTNLQHPLERADLARVAHLSPSHLARVFRQTTGKSPLERLTELRIAQACAMLGESSLPITRIALDVGFNSFSHFTSLFKKKVGVSPSQYRRSGGCAWTVTGTKWAQP